jgi:hypothetical protein
MTSGKNTRTVREIMWSGFPETGEKLVDQFEYEVWDAAANIAENHTRCVIGAIYDRRTWDLACASIASALRAQRPKGGKS